jgi:low temperature requirement protein LtrA
MSERSPLNSQRSWSHVIRPKALAIMVLLWNIPATWIFIWSLRHLEQRHLFERFCLLQAFMLGFALVTVASSSRLQQALFLPQTDLAFVRKRLYVGGVFWCLVSVSAFLVMSI